MFAIVQSGGKQYKVSENDIIVVEKLANAVGDKVKLEVLLISDNGQVVAGNPFVAGAECEAEVVAHGKAIKSLFSNISQRKMKEKNKVTDNHSLN